ncbi:uncharacterized protein LTR77_008147 [Saxophila tyrrhenica]|uniref:Mmc1 C-terminal domain-containing protein n=1 Tax=Saxophila tyrrhenica TaxID=1690608 RepID=A0AAV9P5X0_9PEZI|nr:hypothetical protein LTR77_008147 [Saxophila tyrrhenica]
MPPRLPLTTASLLNGLSERYVCASCARKATRSLTSPRTEPARQSKHTSTAPLIRLRDGKPRRQAYAKQDIQGLPRLARRHASNATLASATAINAPSSVPPAYRELHQKLIALQETAGSYVDLARLQLAARSLEGDDPVSGPSAARKLARVLLSDALSDEERWEQEILESIHDGRDLLLRYGDTDETVQSNPLVKTLNVPSPYLRRHKLEILVTGLSFSSGPSTSNERRALEDAVLVPSLTTPNSQGGRVGFVRYPVHKTILVAEGISSAVQYGSLPPGLADGGNITAALSVPLRSTSGADSAEEEASANSVDIDLAVHALELFRTSKANGAKFSKEWQTSRVGTLAEWMAGSAESTASGLRPAVRGLVASVLSDTSKSISQAEEAGNTTVIAGTVSDTKRQSLESAIASWSGSSHRDLQLNLDTAFATSPSWRRTTWWRLFWRIDDVTVSASDVLRRSWLTESEQALAFLSGRILETGLATPEQLRDAAPQLIKGSEPAEANKAENPAQRRESVAELLQIPSMLARVQQESGVNAQFSPPWPQSINLSRQYMIRTLVPELHRKAQALLLTSLSTIGGSAALGGWFYLATGGGGLYESGAIVALGLVWSLRRLQKKWSSERESFAVTIREDARGVLGEVESHLRKLVGEGGRATVRAEDAQSWQVARQALKECEGALSKIETKR